MFRYLLALAALFGAVAGLAHADYLVIRVNLGVPPVLDNKPMNPMGQPMPNPKGGLGQMMPKGGIGAPAGKDAPPMTLIAVTEYDEKVRIVPRQDPQTKVTYMYVQLRKGSKVDLRFDERMVQVSILGRQPSLEHRAKARKDEMNRPANRTPKKLLEYAEWALSVGLLDDFTWYAEELVKLDPKEAEFASVVKAYSEVKKALSEAPPTRDDAAIVWKDRLDLKGVSRSPRYSLIYDARAANEPPEIKSRMARLEKHFQQFYYWFALHGKAMPLPKRRLVAVQVEGEPAKEGQRSPFQNLQDAFGQRLLAADSFFAPRDNLLVFSSQRTDDASQAFNQFVNKDLVQKGWKFSDLLKGVRPRDKEGEEIAFAGTMALVQKCLQDESELASVSHDGTRQLLAACGILPRNVVCPEWLQFGLPSVFETPKCDPFLRTSAFWPSFGGANWTYTIHFKLLEANKLLDPADEALFRVLSDGYFREAAQSKDPEVQLRARTMAWALNYYLVHRHMDGLLRYGEELNKLPRDLELGDEVYLACFLRAFKLLDPAKGTVDQARVKAFAADWYKVIGLTPVPIKEVLDEAKKAVQDYRDKHPLPGKPPAAG